MFLAVLLQFFAIRAIKNSNNIEHQEVFIICLYLYLPHVFLVPKKLCIIQMIIFTCNKATIRIEYLQGCRSLLSIGGNNLQFYPNFALFSTLGG